MGTWGPDILADDVAADVYADYMERFDTGMTPAGIRRELELNYAEYLEDEDDMPVFWLAMARAQWECGGFETDLLSKVTEIIGAGTGLERGGRRAKLRFINVGSFYLASPKQQKTDECPRFRSESETT